MEFRVSALSREQGDKKAHGATLAGFPWLVSENVPKHGASYEGHPGNEIIRRSGENRNLLG